MNLDTVLPLVPQDKANHFIYGLVLALLGSFSFLLLGLNPIIGAIVFSSSLGAIKEVYDKLSGKGDPDFWDFIATFAGVLPVLLCNIIL